MSIGGAELYANASMLRLVGYDRDAFARLDPGDLVRATGTEEEAGRRNWQAVMDGVSAPTRYEAELIARDGSTIRVMLTLSRIVVQGEVGFMAVASRLAQPRELDLMTTENDADLGAANRRLATMAALMVSHGEDPDAVSRMLSMNADAAVRKGIELAVAELGPPPVIFDVLLMGSLGRSEVSLLADQDHAIIFPDLDAEEEVVRDYFLGLGRRLSDALAAAGYAYCPGGIMAGEPDCCLSLTGWKQTFSAWIRTLEAEDLLRAKIFFDFRTGLDEGRLIPELHAHLKDEVARSPRFLHLLARSILQYEPPLDAFGGFVLEEGEGVATFDVKGVLAQIVDYVRLRALQHGVKATNTRDRLDALAAGGGLKPDTAERTAEAFDFLQGLRLRHQAGRVLARMEPDNRLDPATLDESERKKLKEVFGFIKAVQATLDHEFQGVG
jgi:CBS domain-containing protein